MKQLSLSVSTVFIGEGKNLWSNTKIYNAWKGPVSVYIDTKLRYSSHRNEQMHVYAFDVAFEIFVYVSRQVILEPFILFFSTI